MLFLGCRDLCASRGRDVTVAAVSTASRLAASVTHGSAEARGARRGRKARRYLSPWARVSLALACAWRPSLPVGRSGAHDRRFSSGRRTVASDLARRPLQPRSRFRSCTAVGSCPCSFTPPVARRFRRRSGRGRGRELPSPGRTQRSEKPNRCFLCGLCVLLRPRDVTVAAVSASDTLVSYDAARRAARSAALAARG